MNGPETLEFRSGFVALAGYTNVGKSTLLNRLVGQKIAIVSRKPQTTRNQITGIRTDPDGQIVFIDAPGFHKPRDELNRMMVRTAMEALHGADLICGLTTLELYGTTPMSHFLAELRKAPAPKILVINKIDLHERLALLPVLQEFARLDMFREVIPISARTGENVPRLLEIIKGLLTPGPRYFEDDQVTDKSEKFLAGELIREVIMDRVHKEVPYCTLIDIEQFQEPESGRILEIHAVVFVEKDSQKGILIGKGGAKLKEIGIAARREMERVFGQPLVLKLWVKVRERWRSDSRWLETMGLDS
ncbi:GTPase Era [bacterium]|nr:GTPase Era [candidate division CSSED10-310 bacterium]